MLRTTEALVLRIIEYSETSRIYHLYTRDLGRVSVLAKGAKRTRTFLSCAVDLLGRLKIKLWAKPGADLLSFSGGEVLDGWLVLRRSEERLNAGYFVAEFLRLLTAAEANPELYDLAVATLRALDRGAAVETALACFLGRAFPLLGLGLETRLCTGCGIARPEGRGARISFREGGLVCALCLKSRLDVAGIPADLERVDGPVLDLLEGLASGRRSPDTVDASGASAAAKLLARYAQHQSETEFRTVRFVWAGL